MTFGEVLKEARVKAKITGAQMAEATGWSRIQIHRIEASDSISERTLRRYCDGLGVEPVLRLRKAPSGQRG